MDIGQVIGVIILTLTSINIGLMVSVIYAIRNISIRAMPREGKQVGMVYSDDKVPQRLYAIRPGEIPSVGEK